MPSICGLIKSWPSLSHTYILCYTGAQIIWCLVALLESFGWEKISQENWDLTDNNQQLIYFLLICFALLSWYNSLGLCLSPRPIHMCTHMHTTFFSICIHFKKSHFSQNWPTYNSKPIHWCVRNNLKKCLPKAYKGQCHKASFPQIQYL